MIHHCLLLAVLCFLPKIVFVEADDSFSTNLEVPNLNPPIPIDIYHLIDQSGSIEDEVYLEYLDFALNTTLRLGETIGYDTDSTPGIRVSVLGFGCKMYSSEDETTFFLFEENEKDIIETKFELAREEEHFPEHSRTCIRYALSHVEDSILSSNNSPLRKAIIILYTDGQDGDFGWPVVADSPVFNDEEKVEVFALGIDEHNVGKVTRRIVRDESHVYSDLSEETIEKVSTRMNTFTLDPYELNVSVQQYIQDDWMTVDISKPLIVPLGVDLALSFPSLSETNPQYDTVEVDPNSSIAKYQVLKKYQTQDIDTKTRLDLLKLFKESQSSEEIIEFWNDFSIDQTKHSKVTNEEHYICIFQTVANDHITLATEVEGSLHCSIPTSLFDYDGFENVLVQIYRTGIVSSSDPSEVFQNLLKSFTFQVKFEQDIVLITNDVSYVGDSNCNYGRYTMQLQGETVRSILASPEFRLEDTSSILSVGETDFTVDMVINGNSLEFKYDEILFYEMFVSSGGLSNTLQISFRASEPKTDQQIYFVNSISPFLLSHRTCVLQVETKPVCIGEAFEVNFTIPKSLSFTQADSFNVNLFRCKYSFASIVPNVVDLGGVYIVSCLIPSLEIDSNLQGVGSIDVDLKLKSLVTETEIKLQTAQGLLLYLDSYLCSSSDLEMGTECADGNLSTFGKVTFSGRSVNSILSFGATHGLKCEYASAHNRVVTEGTIVGDDFSCELLDFFSLTSINIVLATTLIPIGEFSAFPDQPPCLNFAMFVENQIIEDFSRAVDGTKNIKVEVTDGLYNLQQFGCNCVWSAADIILTSILDHYEGVGLTSFCILPTYLELIGNGPIEFNVVCDGFSEMDQTLTLPNLEIELQPSSGDSMQPIAANCREPFKEFVFDASPFYDVDNADDILCSFGVDGFSQIFPSEIHNTSYYCFPESIYDTFKLFYQRKDSSFLELFSTVVPDDLVDCVVVESHFNCSETSFYLLKGPTISSIATAKDNVDVERECVIQVGNRTIFPEYTTVSGGDDQLSIQCSIDGTDLLNFLDEGSNPSSIEIGIMVYHDNKTIFEFISELDIEFLENCRTFGTIYSQQIQESPIMSGLFGSTGLMLVVGGFAYSRKRKYGYQNDKINRKISVSTGSSVGLGEELVEAIANKELFLYNSSSFEVNDLVEVTLDTLGVESCTKVGLITNKKFENGDMLYEVKLLDEDNVVITELVETDLKMFQLSVKEAVLVLDEEIEDQWNESVVVAFNAKYRTCDVRQGGSRLNDVPLVCVRRSPKSSIPKEGSPSLQLALKDEIKVKVPNMKQSANSMPKNLFSEPGILKKSNLKRFKTTTASEKTASFNRHKRVKFATNIPTPKFTNTINLPDKKLLEGNFYESENSSYKSLSPTEYELEVDISKGLGVCWVFDRNDASILVGKFVETSNGCTGPIEASGKCEIKDKLLEIDHVPVYHYRSLAQVKDLIRRAKKRNKIVTFRFQRKLYV